MQANKLRHIILLDRSQGLGVLSDVLSSKPVRQLIERSFAGISNAGYADIVEIDQLGEYIKNTNTFEHLIISDIKRFTQLRSQRIEEAVSSGNGFTAIEVNDNIKAYSEKPCITSDGKIAGFCRVYKDVSLEMVSGDRWPEHLIISRETAEKIDWSVAAEKRFDRLAETAGDIAKSFHLSGNVIDLTTGDGLLNLVDMNISLIERKFFKRNGNIADDVKITGDVIIGENAIVQSRAVLHGPVIIGAGCKIGEDAAVSTCVIAGDIEIGNGRYISNRVITTQQQINEDTQSQPARSAVIDRAVKGYLKWPRFSYIRFGKRIFDVIFSLLVLILFAPILPVIALAVKIASPGPVFYKAKRQGLRGKEFGCLKFRTMMVGAENIQSMLRFKNEVDGPQFKMDDDPRISAFGLFLRNTSLDEVPQFFNVLAGQMSVVGPRPSPEDENMRCPYWRDARLSVRPGITGLWQVQRTREPSKDFQEWVHYDTKYVRDVSFKFDMWICYKTFAKLVTDFLDQF